MSFICWGNFFCSTCWRFLFCNLYVCFWQKMFWVGQRGTTVMCWFIEHAKLFHIHRTCSRGLKNWRGFTDKKTEKTKLNTFLNWTNNLLTSHPWRRNRRGKKVTKFQPGGIQKVYSILNKKAIRLRECNEPWCLADGHADREQQPAATSHGLAHRLPHRLLHPHHALLWGLLLSGRGPVLLLPLLPLRLLHLLHVEPALLTAGGTDDWTSGVRWLWKGPIIPLDRWLPKAERPVSRQ